MHSAGLRPALADEELRRAALSPAGSWMVQAPAGSGKTELLMQRFLACLAVVDEPESVLAITFTRKAAAEMRHRILAALQAAGGDDAEPAAELPPHRQRSLALARAVLSTSAARGWNLLAHPARLQIRTLDSFCEAVAQRAPLRDRLGGRVEVTTDARPLYDLAAERVLDELATEGQRGRAVEVLLRHLDADVTRARTELARMLERRGEWLYFLGRSDAFDRTQQRELRQRTEAALRVSVEEELGVLGEQIAAALAGEHEAALFALLRYRASQLAHDGDADCATVDAIAASAEVIPFDSGRSAEGGDAMRDIAAWPAPRADALASWREIADFFLKSDLAFRKSVNKNNGFPPGPGERGEAKNRCLKLLKAVASLPGAEALCQALGRVRTLPDPRYSDQQWEFMLALLELLPLAAAHLQLVFRERGVVDFAEYALRALEAIGGESEPTELGLQLGYRVRHVLVDEFQDTNRVQVDLLARLLGTWEQDESASIFLVGDPMQSIYAFRQADVAMYQQARREGIGGHPHHFGRLRKNFRSQANLVEWFNQLFPLVMQEENDATNAVPYAPAEAVHAALEGTAVELCGFAKGDRVGEARHLAACIRRELDRPVEANEKPSTIAVLVRTRSHLPELVAALREARVPFRAVKTDRLSEHPLVRDLEALRAALTDLADRTAWLAVLRAPWCGLELADLLALCRNDEDSTVRRLLRERDGALSASARTALARCLPVLDEGLSRRGRSGLRSLVEEAWLGLGGPACLDDLRDGARVAEAYFALLDELGAGGAIADPENFAARLDELFAPPDPAAGIRVSIMPIHQAKGLEWDVVFLPALERGTRRDDKRLLYWRASRRGEEELLLLGAMEAAGSGRKGSGSGAPTIESYLRKLDSEAEREERKRLLYVAATRARRRLFLSACVDSERRSNHDSMLSLIWELPGIAEAFAPPTESREAEAGEPAAEAEGGVRLRRLPPTLAEPPAPALPPPLAHGVPPEKPATEEHEFRWVGELLPRAGVVAHAFLARIAAEGVERWDVARVAAVAPAIAAALRIEGVSRDELERGGALVREALERTVNDERGRWLLAPHPEARSEWALTAMLDGELRRVRIDRTFVDGGVRWLIDYKISRQAGGDRERFLALQVEKYRGDLARYARVLQALGGQAPSPHPLRCALYFPLLGAFCEVAVEEASPNGEAIP